MWNVDLSVFLPWDRRGEYPDRPGLYAIARELPDNLIYVGLTMQSEGLRGRLRQFHRSATTGRLGHAGGVTYHKQFGPEVASLLVAVHLPYAINPDPKVMAPYIKFGERLLIWKHVARHGAMPACNSG